MANKTKKKTLNTLSLEFVPSSWQVVRCKTRNKTQRNKVKNEVKFQVHLNHFYDVEPIPFDILVDVPAENCINCLGPRHFKCDKSQSHDYCFNCGRSGVRVNTCPRCRRAYPKYLERRKKTGFGRDTAKAKVDEIQNKPVQPVSKIPSTTPVVAEIQVDPVLPATNESTSWSFAFKSSLMPPATNGIKISSNFDNVQIMNDSFGSHNGNMVESTKMFVFTDDYLKDLAILMGRIKNLPVSNQDNIVLQFISERRKSLDQKKLSVQT